MSMAAEDPINSKYSEDELEVANILVNMRRLMTNFVSDNGFKYNWIIKKKQRSALVSPQKPKFLTPLSKEEASSPNTPFCFSLTDSDSNPDKNSTPLPSSKKELKKTLKEIAKAQKQSKKSIRKVQKYVNPIMAENSVLKTQKRELQMGEKGKKEKLNGTITACSTLQQTSSTPMIQPHDDHIDGVNASTSSQFEHQPPPWIHPYPYHHGAMLGSDPMCGVPSSFTQFDQQAPLICHQAYPILQYHPSQQQEEVATLQIDLISTSPDDEIKMKLSNMIIRRAKAQEARKNRKRVITEKKTSGRS